MKQSNQGFDDSYNAQAVVDSAAQIIVAAEVTNQANDKQQAVPMAQAVLDNLAAAGIEKPKAADGTPTAIPTTADTGYFSEKAVAELGRWAWTRTSPLVVRSTTRQRFRPWRERPRPQRV